MHSCEIVRYLRGLNLPSNVCFLSLDSIISKNQVISAFLADKNVFRIIVVQSNRKKFDEPKKVNWQEIFYDNLFNVVNRKKNRISK